MHDLTNKSTVGDFVHPSYDLKSTLQSLGKSPTNGE